MKTQTALILALLFALFSLLYYTCGKEKQLNEHTAILAKINAENESLRRSIRNQNKEVDTLYIERGNVKKRYDKKIREIKTLDSAQHDSLFGLIYPSKDSANATYYHYLSAREQLEITDSIVSRQDTIITHLERITSNQEQAISEQQKEIKTEKRKVFVWKAATVGALLLAIFL